MQVLMIRSWHLRRFPEPKRGRGGLHGLVDHGQQLGRQRIEIDLVAELGTECLDRPDRVVLATVEAAIHDGLDALSDRLEQGGHGEGGAGDGPARRLLAHLSEELAEDQDSADVASSEDGGE